ncbi:MAG: ABC transporter substrate-binding protein [Anaerobutyricum sp.]
MMRRYLVILMMPCFVMLFGICCLAGCEGSKHHLKKVRLNEVAHSIFYAPQYVAIEKGYFEKEGIKLELTTGFGADKTATAVYQVEMQILAFMGPEATIYQFNEGMQIILSILAQFTQQEQVILL